MKIIVTKKHTIYRNVKKCKEISWFSTVCSLAFILNLNLYSNLRDFLYKYTLKNY
jgi:hypothetical protein